LLLSPGEIDIVEVVNDMDIAYQTIHYGGSGGPDEHFYQTSAYPYKPQPIDGPEDACDVFAVEWAPWVSASSSVIMCQPVHFCTASL
jgi:hypothetical protein